MDTTTTGIICGLVFTLSFFVIKLWIEWTIKKGIEHKFDLDLKTHESQLRHQSEREMAELKNNYTKEIEGLKSQLSIVQAERSFRYSKVFDKTLSSLETTFRQLYVLHLAASDFGRFASGIEGQDVAKFNAARLKIFTALDDFKMTFTPLRIYFNVTMTRMIDTYITSIYTMVNQLSRYISSAMTKTESPYSSAMLDEGFANWEELYKLLAGLENEFRTSLGVSADNVKPDVLLPVLPVATNKPSPSNS